MERIKRHVGVHHITSWKVFFFVAAIIIGGGLGIAYTAHVYPEVFKTEVLARRLNDVDFKEAVVIDFSQPMPAVEWTPRITVSPQEKFTAKWENSNRRLLLIPSNSWKPETSYSINIPEGRSAMLTKVDPQMIIFSTKAFPKVTSVTPQDGSTEITLGAEDPVIINFDKSTDGFFVKFTLDPFSDMTFQNNEDKTQFKLLPKNGVKDGTQYNFKVYVKKLNDIDDNYRQIYAGNFKTVAPVPPTWEKDYALRLDQAKKYTKPKITEGKYIDVNLKAQILCTFENGRLLQIGMISSGKRGMDTPLGNHKIYNKSPRAYSKSYGLYMPYWMAFLPDGKMGLHELPEWPGGYKEGANHLGIPVSHGCVRMGVGMAKAVYDWADIGTPVIIY